MVPPGLIAVVRAASASECRTIVSGLIMAGVPTIELTMTVPDALRVLAEFSAAKAIMGCGTVLDPQVCQACIDAGARFVVSPVTDTEVLNVARRAGVPYVGGALTPSEAKASMRAGVDAVKLFPIGLVGGPKYLRALLEPFPKLRAVVSGGIDPTDVETYLTAGSHSVCIGGKLIDRLAALAGDVDSVARHAQEVMMTINKAREQ